MMTTHQTITFDGPSVPMSPLSPLRLADLLRVALAHALSIADQCRYLSDELSHESVGTNESCTEFADTLNRTAWDAKHCLPQDVSRIGLEGAEFDDLRTTMEKVRSTCSQLARHFEPVAECDSSANGNAEFTRKAAAELSDCAAELTAAIQAVRTLLDP